MTLLRRITLLLLVLSTSVVLSGCPFFTRDSAETEEQEAAPEAEAAPAAAPAEPEAQGGH